ncbi:MAG: response regulator transcription factor, partial [Clostridia bacterium]
LGLDMTANDYLAKPFDFDELLARLRNLTRTNFVQQSVVLSAKNLSFNTATRDVFVDGVEVNLTKREKSILEYLLLNKGSVVQTKKLIDKIWDFSADNAENSLRVHIASLKKKLQIDLIKNKIGEGYYIE